MKKLFTLSFFVLICVLTGCTTDGLGYAEIKYRVKAQCGASDVTYSTSSGGTRQQSNVRNGVVYDSLLFERGDFLYISAQNNCDWGVISVEILKDGQAIGYEWSSGAYAIATASTTF